MSTTEPITRATPRSSEPSTAAADSKNRPPYWWALGAAVLVFGLYALTVGPSTWFWDTSEYIATAHMLGIPHPPGNPAFILLAKTWEILLSPLGMPAAMRINLFSAFMSASTAGLWFLVVHRILQSFSASEIVRRTGAAVAVLISATAFTVWFQSTVNEKVYTVSLLTIAVLSWLAFLWRDHTEAHETATTGARREQARGWHDDNVLILMVFILALSVSNHLMAFLAAPALVVFLFLVRPASFLNLRLYGWAAAFALIGLSITFYLPIRAGLAPVINEADPSCQTVAGAVTSVITMGKAGCEQLSSALAREQYAKPPVTLRQAPFGAQLANYFQYFDWQWSRSIDGRIGYLAPARLPFTLLFLALGIWGAWQHWLRDRKSFAYMATLFVTLSFGLIFYLNFKYGYGQVDARGLSIDLAEVRERDYFFLVSFSVWGLWAGIGLTGLWLALSERVARGPDLRRPLAIASPILALALIPLMLNWPYATRNGDYAARDWAYNLLQSVEPYSVLITNGDNDTFPLWYLQEVEGIRRDVTVIVWSYFNTPWYGKQLRDLTAPCATPDAWAADDTRIICQRAFEPDKAPDFYSAGGLPAAPPATSILPYTDAQLEAITLSQPAVLPQDQLFESGGIQAILPANTVLMPADQLILAIVKEANGQRPVYFAATTNVHRKLGLAPFTARQGVAFKLIDPAQPPAGLLAMPQNDPNAWAYGAYLDVDRHRELLWDTFVHRDLADRPYWPDDATRGIPTYYAAAHIALAQAEAMLGNEAAVQENIAAVEKWSALARR